LNVKAGLQEVNVKELLKETTIDQQTNAKVLQGRFVQPQTKPLKSINAVEQQNAVNANLNEIAPKKAFNTLVE